MDPDLIDEDDGLRVALEALTPKSRDLLRRVLVMDHTDRDAVSARLLRYRDSTGDDLADIIELPTMHPDARRRVVRLLAEIDAEE